MSTQVNLGITQGLTPELARAQVLEIIGFCKRPMDKLRRYLKETDFFTAPAARSHHHATEGGLARHSLEVYELTKHMAQAYPPLPELRDESIIIAAVCHDLCKVNYYVPVNKPASKKSVDFMEILFKQAKKPFPEGYSANQKFCSDLIDWAKNGFNGDAPEPGPQWEIKEDDFPLGHGEKSLYIASKLIELTDIEALAIRWHCSLWEVSDMNRRSWEEAKANPLVTLTALADMQSAWLWGR